MSLDQLDAPLRMTWTLGRGELTDADVLVLADRVASSGLFFLTLQGDFGRFENFRSYSHVWSMLESRSHWWSIQMFR